jgi:hypothetical protein
MTEPDLPVPDAAPTTAHVVVARARGQLRVEARRLFAAGERILHFDGCLVAAPTRYTIQIGEREHVEGPPPRGDEHGPDPHAWRFLNHACKPNAVLRGRWLGAVAAIAPGDEITFDYTTTEFDMACPFVCGCGAPDCLGLVRGWRWLTPAQQAARLPALAAHLRHAATGSRSRTARRC